MKNCIELFFKITVTLFILISTENYCISLKTNTHLNVENQSNSFYFNIKKPIKNTRFYSLKQNKGDIQLFNNIFSQRIMYISKNNTNLISKILDKVNNVLRFFYKFDSLYMVYNYNNQHTFYLKLDCKILFEFSKKITKVYISEISSIKVYIVEEMDYKVNDGNKIESFDKLLKNFDDNKRMKAILFEKYPELNVNKNNLNILLSRYIKNSYTDLLEKQRLRYFK